jgi:hopanoid biosynthesis associated protein HpnK
MSAYRAPNRVIITADDFGRSTSNNAGVLAAHLAGMVATASLMVGEPGCEEAVEIARQHPALMVGLHVCLSDGSPVSPPSSIPLLIGSDGRFPDNERQLHAAVRTAEGRRQVHHEVEAQFRLFSDTRLVCDHVDVHRNSHMHPLVANQVFRVAAAWAVTNVRVPYDPAIGRPHRLGDPLRWVRSMVLRRLAAYHGLQWMDRVIGRDWTDPAQLAALIAILPSGTSELFFHPVICDGEHMFKLDLPTLLDSRVRQALDAWQPS